MYRAPTGYFIYFINKLEIIFHSIYKTNIQFTIFSYLNINYLLENNFQKVLVSLFSSYSISSTVCFPTRYQNSSAMATDNIFIDTSKYANYITSPQFNGLSNNDAQFIMIYDTDSKFQKDKTKTIRKNNKYTMFDFQIKPSFESWESVFENDDIDTLSNSFLNTYLRIFYSSFPLKKLNPKTEINTWITPGLRNSCECKRDLYLLCRNSNKSKLKPYYKLYCKILSNVIKEVKKYYYNIQIENSDKKMKTVWNITTSLTGKKIKNEVTYQLNIDGNITYDKLISETFHNYLLSITKINYKNIDKSNNNPLEYLHKAFNNP